MEKIPDQLVNMMMDVGRESRFTISESLANFAFNRLNSRSSTEPNEKTIIKILLAIEEKFRSYFEANQKELELQRIAAQTLWHLVQRYMIAVHVDTSCSCPKIYEIETEEAIINKYHMHYQVIVGSNKSQMWGIQSLRPFVLAFRRECAKLNFDVDTPLIMGDSFHKPIKFFIQLVDDIFNYFYSRHMQLDCAARLLSPADQNSMEHYQELLAPNEDFNEFFLFNLNFCKCLRLPPKCVSVVRESRQKETKEVMEAYKAKAKKARCARRFKKMCEMKSKAEMAAIKHRVSLFNSPSAKNSLSLRDSTTSIWIPSLQHQRSLKFLLGSALSVQNFP